MVKRRKAKAVASIRFPTEEGILEIKGADLKSVKETLDDALVAMASRMLQGGENGKRKKRAESDK